MLKPTRYVVSSFRVVGLVSVIALASLFGAVQAAHAAPLPSSVTVYTPDHQWRADIDAYKHNLLVYRSIGTEVTTYHWEQQRRWYDPWYNFYHWVEKPAATLELRNTYTGNVDGLPSWTTSFSLGNWNQGQSHLESKEWYFGLGLTIPCDLVSCSGGPAPALGPSDSINLTAVTGAAQVYLPGEPVIGGAVQAS